jgi:hypothetical protein
MASYSLIMNQIALDSEFYVWGCGQDLRRFNGDSWEYYDYTNSAVPSGFPYFLDTRSIDIDNEDVLWCGVAQGPTAGLNEVAVFSMNTNDVSLGKSWKFSDLGVFNQPQEISLVYACPFGDDVLAFSTPLNGIGGTGTTGYTEVNGVTGGRLFYYLKEIDKWQETVPGYKWPHIYDIKAKGYEGKDYFYYVATSEGLFTMPQGSQEVQYLDSVGEIVEQVEVYNTKTSEIISDNIYSIDLDEDGNLWIGTDLGLSFFNGKKFWNFPNDQYVGVDGPVTKVLSRPNGHVFFTIGDGELHQGTGFYHFNGSSINNFTDGSPSPSSTQTYIGNNDVLDLKLIKHNTKQGNLTLYENSLWVLCYNDLASFNYDQPHVYGSSRNAGATGWNFTYFNEAKGLDNIPIPKVNKYTWSYPEWRVYQDEYLAKRFPGLDERNLFLTTKLSDIADGSAGKQSYWNNWPIQTFEDKQKEDSIQPTYFNNQITLAHLSPPDIFGQLSGSITITCSTSLKTRHGIKYYVGGYLNGNVEATFGYDYNGNPISLKNLNPTLGGNIDYGTYPSNSHDYGAMGFVVTFSEYGTVDAIIPFRGYRTYVQDIAPSEDENFIAVSGYFSRFIENGPYIWDSLETENALRGGPTGAPAGLTNNNYYTSHSSDFPWCNSTSTIGSGTWQYTTTVPPISTGFNVNFQNNQNFEEVVSFSFNYNDIFGNQTSQLQSFVTGNVLNVTYGAVNASYIINSVENIETLSGLIYNVTYASGATGPFTPTPGSNYNFLFYDTKSGVFPAVKGLRSRAQYWNTNQIICNSPFVAKIGRDLGNTTSFTGLGQNSDFTSDVRKSYRGLGFRHFPAKYMSKRTDLKNSKVDITKYSINLALSSFVNLSVNRSVIKTADVSTLKNLWKRTNDGFYTSEKILGTTYPISQTWSGDSVMSYVRLSSDDLSLMATTNSQTYQIGSLTSSTKNLSIAKSMHNDSSTIITGNSNRSFSMAGIDFFNGTQGTYNQFYILIDGKGLGITGGYVNGKSGSSYLPKATNDQSVYYVTTEFGASGSYFGNNFIAESATGSYFLTSTITEQGTPKTFYKTFVGRPSISTFLDDVELSGDDQYLITYKTIGSTNPPFYNMLKTDLTGVPLASINFGGANLNCFTSTTDPDGNIFMSGYYYRTDGFDYDGYIYLSNDSGFSLLSKRHKADLGLNMGQIISRPGSGAWTWCDVHSTNSGMQIPLMTTVVFNNYASNIYGKKNNKWILSDSVTGEEILNVKNTPYFIYTFTAPGNYTIYNSVEDAAGNVYVQTNPGYIEVINHKQKNPNDKRPDFVNSFDYGQPEVFPGRDYQVHKLAKDMEQEQASILKGEAVPFGAGFTVYHNPDATFRQDG